MPGKYHHIHWIAASAGTGMMDSVDKWEFTAQCIAIPNS